MHGYDTGILWVDSVMDMGAKSLLRFAIVLCGLCAICPAWGIVLHPDNEPNLVTWVDHPPVSVVGRWGTNASCVAVAPNYVITTKHQGISAGTTVEFDGVSYTIDDYWDHPDVANPVDPNFVRVDLRLAKLHAANLTEYVDVYGDSNEVTVSDMVIGGYGDGRGTILENSGTVYGYAWDTSNGNTVQRWCTNEIEASQDDTIYCNPGCTIKYNIDSLWGFFDDPGETAYEGIPADHDSGGGWFIYSGAQWYVTTLTVGVEHFGESHFRNETKPSQTAPDYIFGLRLSSYVDWIYENIVFCSEMLEMDLNGDCLVDAGDLADFAIEWLRDDCDAGNNFCQGADVVDIGTVNMSDFAALASIWLEP